MFTCALLLSVRHAFVFIFTAFLVVREVVTTQRVCFLTVYSFLSCSARLDVAQKGQLSFNCCKSVALVEEVVGTLTTQLSIMNLVAATSPGSCSNRVFASRCTPKFRSCTERTALCRRVLLRHVLVVCGGEASAAELRTGTVEWNHHSSSPLACERHPCLCSAAALDVSQRALQSLRSLDLPEPRRLRRNDQELSERPSQWFG